MIKLQVDVGQYWTPMMGQNSMPINRLGGKYDLEKFNNAKVRFDDPKKRLKDAMSN